MNLNFEAVLSPWEGFVGLAPLNKAPIYPHIKIWNILYE